MPNTNNELGIENAKKLVLLAKIVTWFFKALEDNKIDFSEGWQAVGFVPDMWNIIKNGKDIWAELKDLDAEELAELVDAFAEEFDINDDELEADVEEILDGGLEMSNGAIKIANAVKRIVTRAKASKEDEG